MTTGFLKPRVPQKARPSSAPIRPRPIWRWLPRILGWSAVVILLLLVARGALDVMVGSPLTGIGPDRSTSPLSVTDPEYTSAAESLIPLDLVAGNRIEVLTTGELTYRLLWDDLRAASSSISIQQYYCHPGIVLETLTDVLVERSTAGVEVRLLLDGIGCRDLADSTIEALRRAGIELEVFRPARWYDLHRLQHRSHVRSVVIDGRIGYTGGFGFDDKWLNPAAPADEWRETNVRMSGPVVAQLHAAFAIGWSEATGELLVDPGMFPAATAPAGGQVAGILYSTSEIGTTAAERFLALAIEGAAETLFITNSYFVPDADFRRMMVTAARRGVDVRVLTAGESTDVPLTRLASRHRYDDLLDGGVRIYELNEVMVHSKTVVVDGSWSSIGTMNFDNRSLRLNEELNLVATDSLTAAALDTEFRSKIGAAHEITREEFDRRGWIERAKELGARAIWFLL